MENEIFSGSGFYIRYNPCAGSSLEMRLINQAWFKSHGNPKTSIIVEEPFACYTLNGDFREAYRAVLPDLAACMAIFHANQEHLSDWSDTLPKLDS